MDDDEAQGACCRCRIQPLPGWRTAGALLISCTASFASRSLSQVILPLAAAYERWLVPALAKTKLAELRPEAQAAIKLVQRSVGTSVPDPPLTEPASTLEQSLTQVHYSGELLSGLIF